VFAIRVIAMRVIAIRVDRKGKAKKNNQTRKVQKIQKRIKKCK